LDPDPPPVEPPAGVALEPPLVAVVATVVVEVLLFELPQAPMSVAAAAAAAAKRTDFFTMSPRDSIDQSN
jgi:hypothetical protein